MMTIVSHHILRLTIMSITISIYFIDLNDLFFFFFFNDTATTEIYTLSLHDALPISVIIGEGIPGEILPLLSRPSFVSRAYCPTSRVGICWLIHSNANALDPSATPATAKSDAARLVRFAGGGPGTASV